MQEIASYNLSFQQVQAQGLLTPKLVMFTTISLMVGDNMENMFLFLIFFLILEVGILELKQPITMNKLTKFSELILEDFKFSLLHQLDHPGKILLLEVIIELTLLVILIGAIS